LPPPELRPPLFRLLREDVLRLVRLRPDALFRLVVPRPEFRFALPPFVDFVVPLCATVILLHADVPPA